LSSIRLKFSSPLRAKKLCEIKKKRKSLELCGDELK
jgi:hypothetical protein